MKKYQQDPIVYKNNSLGIDHEIIKAAAQAWLGHQSTTRPAASEFDARRLNFKSRLTRFATEAIRKATNKKYDHQNNFDTTSRDNDCNDNIGKWDFGQSLWDCYEIVTVAKKLEVGLMLDHPFTSSLDDPIIRIGKKKKIMHKESKNSLRNLLSKISSKRYSGDDVPRT